MVLYNNRSDKNGNVMPDTAFQAYYNSRPFKIREYSAIIHEFAHREKERERETETETERG